MTAYALVQQEATVPTADQLKRAFKLLKRMTEADAIKVAREAYGILMRNLPLDEASTLQRALAGEGVPTEIVEAGQLPGLPDARFIRRAELRSEALVVSDPLGRPVPVLWPQIALIAAGACRHFGISQTRTEQHVTSFDPIHGIHRRVEVDVRHKVEDDVPMLLDLLLTGAAMRFQIEADQFQFKHLFDRPDLDRAGKMGLLIQRLGERAPQAWLNRGAFSLRDGSSAPVTYASKAAFFEESIWLLWRQAKHEPAPGPPR
jgi:hypothetical protein